MLHSGCPQGTLGIIPLSLLGDWNMAGWFSHMTCPWRILTVLLYMVCHESHQYTPVMLAYIPAPWIRHGYVWHCLTIENGGVHGVHLKILSLHPPKGANHFEAHSQSWRHTTSHHIPVATHVWALSSHININHNIIWPNDNEPTSRSFARLFLCHNL
jgi:hypothetical protein